MLGGKSKRLSPLFKIREDLPPIIGVLPKAVWRIGCVVYSVASEIPGLPTVSSFYR